MTTTTDPIQTCSRCELTPTLKAAMGVMWYQCPRCLFAARQMRYEHTARQAWNAQAAKEKATPMTIV